MHVRVDCEAGASKVEIRKVGSARECSLPFWGRVVTETVARTQQKSQTLPLVDASGHVISLFLDLTSHANHARNDCCIAPLIKPLKPEPTADDAIDQSNARNRLVIPSAPRTR